MLSCPFTFSIFIPEVSSQLPAGAENKHDSLYQVGNFLFEVGSDKIISKKSYFKTIFSVGSRSACFASSLRLQIYSKIQVQNE